MSKLPDQWIDVPLSEVTDINPPHPDRPIENDQLVSFVPMALVTEESGKLDASQLRLWREVNKGYTRFQEGDVLFAKITPCMENGKFALARGLNGGVGAGSTEFHVLRPLAGIRSRYLLNFLFQSDVRRAARMEMKGAAGQLRVPTSFLERLRFPVAPPEEQDRIVAEIEKQFTRLDAATTALKRVQANLKRYRASVLKAACEGRLVPIEAELARKEGRDYEPADKLLERILRERRARWEADTLAKMIASGKPPKDESWRRNYKEPSAPDSSSSADLPEGWTWTTLEALADAVDPQPSHRTPAEETDGIPYIGMGDVTKSGRIDRENARKVSRTVLIEHRGRYQLRNGDFFVGKIGTIGNPVRVDEPFDYALSANVVLIQAHACPFLFWYASTPKFAQLLGGREPGHDSGCLWDPKDETLTLSASTHRGTAPHHPGGGTKNVCD